MLLWACGPIHDRDSELSLSDAQVVGTHNSYHVETTALYAWAYTHAPLDVQICELGVRQLEIDLYWAGDHWDVLHLPDVDDGTTCATWSDCLADMVRGSKALGDHLPIMVMVEIKEVSSEEVSERLRVLDDRIHEVLGAEHLLSPAAFGALSADAGAVIGSWPVLEGQRGRFVFVMHDRGQWAEAARAMDGDTLFLDGFGDPEPPWALFHSMNSPTDARIAPLVDRGHLVRTRADSDVVEPDANDTTRLQDALQSGAHFISTDFVEPHPTTGYVVEMPGGEPARCNPRSEAPCEPRDLEDRLSSRK